MLSNNGKRTVCVVLVDRANYGRLKPVMRAIQEHPALELQVLAAGTMVLERFDQPVRVVRKDGFAISGEIYTELEGSTPATMAKSVGFGVVEFSSELHRLKPDVVLLIGDRYEALSAAIAAAYMNIPLIHLQGGEVSGSIDESARHAITKFAQFHVPSTKRSAEYIMRMGERPDTVLTVGCPSSDIARSLDRTLPSAVVNSRGNGVEIDVTKPFFLVIFHPTTTEFGAESDQMQNLLKALDAVRVQSLVLWPNIDAGSDHISKMIRVYRNTIDRPWMRTLTNLTPEDYLKVLANTACAIGNSSSFVRDAGYFGTPVVLVGNRQNGRETDVHAVRVSVEVDAIRAAIEKQFKHGRYAPSTLYGDGHVSQRVADAVAALKPYVQKRLAFVHEDL
ncbi:MAG: UDP-N-acetylglucosamine 2-epimerase (hydrolyzing) [Pirellulales bacterium]|nr:UDP-N-acetylglucosamine 2-epimerase (hydrolyzing) [Pirellulales bacterium]